MLDLQSSVTYRSVGQVESSNRNLNGSNEHPLQHIIVLTPSLINKVLLHKVATTNKALLRDTTNNNSLFTSSRLLHRKTPVVAVHSVVVAPPSCVVAVLKAAWI